MPRAQDKHNYSSHYFPPAPVLSVHLVVLEESVRIGPYDALIDTGSDGTFVPTFLVEELDLPVEYMTNVRSHLNERLISVSVHKVDILLYDTIKLPSIDVVAHDEDDEIILGRNLLNKIHLYLDGPNEITRFAP
ncbi:MAG: aspartyl protease family protein [Chloroflexota bacterium]